MFSGKLLHGCPEQLVVQQAAPDDRVTLLVNLWRRAKPAKVRAMPSSLSDMLSKKQHVIHSKLGEARPEVPVVCVERALALALDEDLLDSWGAPPLPNKESFHAVGIRGCPVTSCAVVFQTGLANKRHARSQRRSSFTQVT